MYICTERIELRAKHRVKGSGSVENEDVVKEIIGVLCY